MKRFALLLLLVAASATAAERTPHPNIVFLLSDDLGWADLGCYGSTFHETPALDRLAREGVRFTTYYTAGSICSPTRASLMTGKYPVRTGITDWIPGMKPPANARLAPAPTKRVLPADEFTFARAFQEAGYQTRYIGKWHLGPTNAGLNAYGWDDYVGDDGGEESEESAPAGKNGKQRKLSERRTSTERFTQASLAFLEKRDRAKPFFLMLSYHDVHTPIQPMAGQVEHYRTKLATLPAAPAPIAERNGYTRARQDNPDYASMVATVDASVAQIRARLTALGLADHTIVIFASDNGGLATQKKPGPTSNAPLRSGKGWLYEGGIRAPLIVRVPGARAGVVSATPVISTDLYPTLLELAGLPLRPAQHVDGVSFSALARGGEAPPSRTFYWHYPHYHGSTWSPGAALRDGDWKLIEFYDPAGAELYDLKSDPGEARDLAPTNAAKTTELLGKLHAWQQAAGAIRPAPGTAP